MLTLSRQTPKRGTTCQRCMIIRYFILMGFALALLLIAIDKDRAYLGAITPMHAAIVIIAVGIVGFVTKMALWKLKERVSISSGYEQAERQEACSAETDQTSSR